jgi:hypothetical protein
VADSENEPKPLPQSLPEGVTSLVVRNPKDKDGVTTTREVLKNAKGQFVKKPKPLIPTIEFTRRERKKLYSPSKDKGKEGLTEHDVAFLNMLRIAQNEDSDPKAMMAAVKAYEILMRRALGKEAPSEQELDKLTSQAVKVVVIQAPQLMHPEIIEEKPQEVLKPSFAEVLDVHTNPKP